MRLSQIVWQPLAGLNRVALAGTACALGRPGLRHLMRLFLVAELRIDVLSIVPVRYAVAREVSPQISGCRLVHIGNLLLNRIPIIDDTLVVIGPFPAAIRDLPRLLGVIAGDGR